MRRKFDLILIKFVGYKNWGPKWINTLQVIVTCSSINLDMTVNLLFVFH